MLKPKMIMFDYGNTLVYEDVQDNPKAFARIYEYIIRNDNDIDVETLYIDFRKYKREIFDRHHNVGFEAKYVDIFRFFMGIRGIEFAKPLYEIEEIYFDDYAFAHKMPNVDKFLNLLDSECIRTAVISNISITSENLSRRIEKLFGDRFEFVITSNDYIHRKPSKEIFEIALAKAKVKAEEVWYIGDNPLADVVGATECKIYPVLFDAPFENHFRWEHEYFMPDCEFLKVESYEELINKFKNMEWD